MSSPSELPADPSETTLPPRSRSWLWIGGTAATLLLIGGLTALALALNAGSNAGTPADGAVAYQTAADLREAKIRAAEEKAAAQKAADEKSAAQARAAAEKRAAEDKVAAENKAAVISIVVLKQADSFIRKGTPKETKVVALTVELTARERTDIDLGAETIALEGEAQSFRTCYVRIPAGTKVECVEPGTLSGTRYEDEEVMKVDSGTFRFAVAPGQTKLLLVFAGAQTGPKMTLKFPKARQVVLDETRREGTVKDQEPDTELADTEIKKLTELKKRPFPFFAKGKEGVITLENGKDVKWNEQVAVWIPQLNWTWSSVYASLKDGAVFVNVGNYPVKVSDFVLKKGEYALLKDKKLMKVTLKELESD